jgi:hypothetical protein
MPGAAGFSCRKGSPLGLLVRLHICEGSFSSDKSVPRGSPKFDQAVCRLRRHRKKQDSADGQGHLFGDPTNQELGRQPPLDRRKARMKVRSSVPSAVLVGQTKLTLSFLIEPNADGNC